MCCILKFPSNIGRGDYYWKVWASLAAGHTNRLPVCDGAEFKNKLMGVMVSF
jgi:hypothetical protein